jgi:DNA primase
MADSGDDPVKKAAAIHEIVESVALVPDLVLRSLYIQQCSRLLQVNEQALISEMNKVLRKQYRKKIGGDQHVRKNARTGHRRTATDVEDVGTTPQERDLLRMLLSYGHERIMVPSRLRTEAPPKRRPASRNSCSSCSPWTISSSTSPSSARSTWTTATPATSAHRGCAALRRSRTGRLAHHRHRPAHREARAECELEGRATRST